MLGRGAVLAAAATFPWADAALAGRRRQRGPDFNCLAATDKFRPVEVVPDSTFVSFAPDGKQVAAATPRGIEVRPRRSFAGNAVSGPGFRIADGAWHPDGSTVIASGPAVDGASNAPAESLHALRADGSGATRLLKDLPGSSRAACFSPDGRRVAFTYVDGFLHRLAVADWVDGSPPQLQNPRLLLPFDPRTEEDADAMFRGLAWYETRGFSPDGQKLVFASDRGGGMLNAQVYTLDMGDGRIRHVTRDDGFSQGALIAPGGGPLIYGSTRAREPSFLTTVTGPGIPPFLGFVAGPTLHDRIAAFNHAPIGNGDVLAADPVTGLRTRMIARREVIVKSAGTGRPAHDHRIVACSMSRDGRELAVAALAPTGAATVIFRRSVAPRPGGVGTTPLPPGAEAIQPPQSPGAPPRQNPDLLQQLLGVRPPQPGPVGPPPIKRTIKARYDGEVEIELSGTLTEGTFQVRFTSFSNESNFGFSGPVRFEVNSAGFNHSADVRALRGDQETRGFYRAAIHVASPSASGTMESRGRFGPIGATGNGSVFVPQGRNTGGRRKAGGVAGAQPCRRRRRRKRRPGKRRSKR